MEGLMIRARHSPARTSMVTSHPFSSIVSTAARLCHASPAFPFNSMGWWDAHGSSVSFLIISGATFWDAAGSFGLTWCNFNRLSMQLCYCTYFLFFVTFLCILYCCFFFVWNIMKYECLKNCVLGNWVLTFFVTNWVPVCILNSLGWCVCLFVCLFVFFFICFL